MLSLLCFQFLTSQDWGEKHRETTPKINGEIKKGEERSQFGSLEKKLILKISL